MAEAPTNLFAGLEGVVAENHPLRRHTWYRIGGPARYFVRPTSRDQLADAVRRCADHGVAIHVLGLGANLLVRDDPLDGAVFRLDDAAWQTVEHESTPEGELLHVGGGVDLQKLILRAIRMGLGGIETLAGIPATVGGAVRMNAGGRFGDLGSVVDRVTLMDARGHVVERSHDELVFEYRRCDLPEPFVLGATLRLDRGDPDELMRRCREVWMYKRNTQPLNARSAGCMFKNPGDGHPSAGALIERAGLKGFRVGRAEVSGVHANFLVAHPDCPSADVLELMRVVRDRVLDGSGVDLHAEVRVW